jgi:hypothetical protein
MAPGDDTVGASDRSSEVGLATVRVGAARQEIVRDRRRFIRRGLGRGFGIADIGRFGDRLWLESLLDIHGRLGGIRNGRRR